MKCKVDYLAFTVPVNVFFEEGDLDDVDRAYHLLDVYLDGLWTPITGGHSRELYKSKGFYHTRIFDTDMKVSTFIGNVNRNIYVEVGGVALDIIRASGLYEDLRKKVASRTSRIDFAVDFESKVSVGEFIVNRQKGRFKAGGNVFSEDGETAYVGSWKAERFARVYRYHEPHPRAKMLRAEVVLRGSYAKQAQEIITSEGEVAACMAAHEPFGWTHPLWKPDVATISSIKSKRSDKESASTLRWLNGDVAACVVKLHGEGLLDAYEWFDKYVGRRIPRKPDIIDFAEENLSSSGTSDATSH